MRDTDAFFHAPPTTDYEISGETLRFPSALVTPHQSNNVVTVRVFPAELKPGQPKRAVIVLPQWNADPEGHVGLCRVFARFGITALRLSLPYHDARKPTETERAEFIVSTNVGRTLHANRRR